MREGQREGQREEGGPYKKHSQRRRTHDAVVLSSFVIKTSLQKITKNAGIDSSAPTKIEVADTLKRLKNNKSSCDVPPEYLKYAAELPGFVDLFFELTCEIWSTKMVPKNFGHGRLEALFKNKGSNKLAKNYRGLNIGSCVAKVVISIILERLKYWYNTQLSYHQCGFRPGMGTTDAIYILIQDS